MSEVNKNLDKDVLNRSQLEEDNYEKRYPKWSKMIAARGAKDSVFADLFSDPEYLLELYRSLFPEDTSSTKDDLEILTLENVLVNGSYNDLGFLVKDKLLILIEAQSTWNPNIPMRMLNYVAYSYREYQAKHKLNNFGSKLEKYPFPEFYVVYTGSPLPSNCRKLHLKDCFMDVDSKNECFLDCVVNLIDISNSSGILTEYISFCTIYTDMVKTHGYVVEAVKKTIRICKDKNILKRYLESKEVEVTRILSQVFDQETAILSTVQALEHERDKVQGQLDDAQEKLDDTKNKLDVAQEKLDDTKNKLDDSIRKFIGLCFEMNFPDENIIERVSKEFDFSYEKSKDLVLKCKK